MKVSALNIILNKDLHSITEILIINPKAFDKYRVMSGEEKKDLIKKMTRSTPIKFNQWKMVIPDDD